MKIKKTVYVVIAYEVWAKNDKQLKESLADLRKEPIYQSWNSSGHGFKREKVISVRSRKP